MRPDPENATEEEIREHLRSLGWTDKDILVAGPLPWQVLLLSNRPLTQAEEEHALTLQKELERKKT